MKKLAVLILSVVVLLMISEVVFAVTDPSGWKEGTNKKVGANKLVEPSGWRVGAVDPGGWRVGIVDPGSWHPTPAPIDNPKDPIAR